MVYCIPCASCIFINWYRCSYTWCYQTRGYEIGKEAGFKKLLSITAYSYLVTIAGIILKTPLSLIKQSAEIHTSLLLFSPFLKQETFFYNFFAQIDFFNIWAFILLSIGISVVSEFDRKKSYILVFVTWLLFAAGLATLATIGLRMGGLK
ncbi:YIP1 family protein [candidate division WOR-3 bacterium]|nr:YIP1 family protein [candidate division WOR-3 bacterium]